MKTLFFTITVLISLSINASESGYLSQGKNVVVFKDGVKVGEWPKADRKPANIIPNVVPNKGTYGTSEIRYEEDTSRGVVCYVVQDTGGVSCVKFK